MKMRNRHGETIIESLVSMLIIALTTAMLTMTVATVLRSYQRAEQTPTFADRDWSPADLSIDTKIEGVDVILDGGDTPIGTVTVTAQGTGDEGRLYYYAGDWTPTTSDAGTGGGSDSGD